MSTAYYAMFHALCEMNANCILGGKSKNRCERAWVQTYRALNHKDANSACERCTNANYSFPPQIIGFGDYFKNMFTHRQKADYDPKSRYKQTEVVDLIDGAKRAVENLKQAPQKHKKAFAAFMLFKFRD